MSVSVRGSRGAEELELELELLLLAPRSSFSAKRSLTPSAPTVDVVSFDASVRRVPLPLACPLSFEGVKKPLRI